MKLHSYTREVKLTLALTLEELICLKNYVEFARDGHNTFDQAYMITMHENLSLIVTEVSKHA